MSVRVNLLPDDVRKRSEASRSRLVAALLAVVLIAVLATLSLLQRGSISDAEAQLAAVEAENTALQADIAALQPFADLQQRADAGVELIGLALGREASIAAVLQDLSAVLPPTAQIESLSISVGEDEEPSPGGDRLIVGRIAASGRVVDGVAPGVERLVIDMDRVAAFDNAYVSSTVVDEDGVASFSLEIELGPEVLTDRYGIATSGGGA